MDLITELVAQSGHSARHVAYGLAYHIWLAVKAGKTIRSLGFVAENLIRRIYEGDNTWVYDLPSLNSQEDLDSALALARRYVSIAREVGIAIDERALTGTIELEVLVKILGAERTQQFAAEMRHAPGPHEGQTVCEWHYFEQVNARRASTPAAKAAASEQKRAGAGIVDGRSLAAAAPATAH